MPRDSRSTSSSASSSEAYALNRVPPRAGPRAVSWMAMIARIPVCRSKQNTTCSWPCSAILSKTPTSPSCVRGHAGQGRSRPAPLPGRRRRVPPPPSTIPPERGDSRAAPPGPGWGRRAGTGKTRVISRRVAYAIATGAVHPGHVLVVTFTDKAANEMRERLAALGFPGVQAQTFHAAAFRQLRYFWPRLSDARLPEVLDSKAPLLAPIQRSLPGGYKFTAIKDLADELEWAKARRLDPSSYQAAAEAIGRTPPVPADLFTGVFRRYERAKERAGRIDFEDMLVRMLEGFERREDVAEEFRGQYRWFSVDEYQDTNPLQQALLEAWLGERRDLAVVGDEDQTIYTFTGATSAYLTGFVRRFPEARVVRLEENYRSSPQVLALANRLLAATPGRRPETAKRLVATRPSGPEPTVAAFQNAEREGGAGGAA